MRSSMRLLVAFVALIFCIHSVVAAPRAAVRRQDDNQIETQSGSGVRSAQPTATPSSSTAELKSARASTIILTTKSSDVPSSTITSHVPSTSTTDKSVPLSTANAASENKLPLQPKLTPAMGLSGVILLLSGLVYGIIGIKNKWVYVFGSAAYLTALAVSVLIVYLMSPPVSHAVQGGFFVAAFITGVIFGALSLVFSDITEGFGCLLGGFCLSMWFLSLKDGGLISSTTGRAIFIGCMSAGGYSLSFSHYTRNHGLIASIAFSGATVAILGIDCLASSGWKEFWLYLWNLNDDVFPLNTNTYPVTKNIKAELAGVVIIAVFGVISQLRVWKIVQEHRANSAAQQLEKQQDQEREEEALGRKIEDDFHKERAQWEATYGNGDKSVQDYSISSSTAGPKGSISIRETEISGHDSVELVNLKKGGVTQTLDGDTPAGTTVTISVLNDDDIRQIDGHGNPVEQQTTHAASIEIKSSKESSPPPPPTVIPLPFVVPTEDDANSADDNTSVSAIPDSGETDGHDLRPMSKRISDMSAMKFRASYGAAYSRETLISDAEGDDLASSVAATLDNDNDINSLHQESPPHSPLDERHSTPLEDVDALKQDVETQSSTRQAVAASLPLEERHEADKSTADTAPVITESHMTVQQPLAPSTNPQPEDSPQEQLTRQESRVRADTLVPGVVEEQDNLQSKDAQSTTPTQAERAESHVGSLRNGMLPARLSKVAQSYRTNEWAKHLEAAEKPSLEDLDVPDSPGIALAKGLPREVPAPISDELASPLMGSKRTSRRTSREGTTQGDSSHDLVRSASAFSQTSSVGQPVWTQSPPAVPIRNISRLSSSTQVDVLAPLPSNTLMGQRESLIRNRVSSQSLTPQTSAANLLVEQKETENMTLAQRRQILQQQKKGMSTLQHQTSSASQRKGPPSTSQKWQNKGWSAKGAQPGFDSHQPKRSSNSQTNQKREQLYTGWRDNMRDVTPPQTAAFIAEQQHQALLNERRQKELERQHRELQRQQRASQMENMMRSGQMLDAHREAMRRMQADANKRS